jgi:hypothetical protein
MRTYCPRFAQAGVVTTVEGPAKQSIYLQWGASAWEQNKLAIAKRNLQNALELYIELKRDDKIGPLQTALKSLKK